ncbi:hypothetical protein D918_09721 [Trichuris suis]|nr:hypothetical protein D918_09721 [Trichuris suis]
MSGCIEASRLRWLSSLRQVHPSSRVAVDVQTPAGAYPAASHRQYLLSRLRIKGILESFDLTPVGNVYGKLEKVALSLMCPAKLILKNSNNPYRRTERGNASTVAGSEGGIVLMQRLAVSLWELRKPCLQTSRQTIWQIVNCNHVSEQMNDDVLWYSPLASHFTRPIGVCDWLSSCQR